MLQETLSKTVKLLEFGKTNKEGNPISKEKRNKERVACLINPKSNVKIISKNYSVVERLISIVINDQNFTILNIYGPNEDNIDVFQILETYLLENNDKNIIVDGDINTVIKTSIDQGNK